MVLVTHSTQDRCGSLEDFTSQPAKPAYLLALTYDLTRLTKPGKFSVRCSAQKHTWGERSTITSPTTAVRRFGVVDRILPHLTQSSLKYGYQGMKN